MFAIAVFDFIFKKILKSVKNSQYTVEIGHAREEKNIAFRYFKTTVVARPEIFGRVSH